MWNNSFYARQISTLPITSFRWDLNFRRDRSKEQFHLREWVGVLVDWRNGRRSIDGWGKCRTDERTNPNRIVYFALRVLAANFKKTYFIFYGKHRSSNYKKLKPGIESKEPRTCKSGGLITALWSVVLTTRFIFCCRVRTVWILHQEILSFG